MFIRTLAPVLISIFATVSSYAQLPSDFTYPRTVSTIRDLIPEDGFLNGCRNRGGLRECWKCFSQGCTYRVYRTFDEWEVRCSLGVFPERHSKSCGISGKGIGVRQEMHADTSKFSFYARHASGKYLHEYRPVYVSIDHQRFIHPEDGSYSELDLQSEEGVLLGSEALLEMIADANRITTECWDLDDQKSAQTDRGYGFSDAREFVSEFQTWTQ